MQFNSFQFLQFFVVVFVVYHLLPHRSQNRFLLAASYFFYGSWDWRFTLLLAATTIIDYQVGRGLGRIDDEQARRRLLILSLTANLAVLGTFKYFNFFADSTRQLAAHLGLEMNPVLLHVVLPVGVSFYTFQSMAYTIDVFRRRTEPCRDFFDFALFVAYFPQLVAGPIERAQQMLPQFQRPRPRLSAEQLQSGLTLIIMGLVRKVVIADTAAPIVARIFGDPSAFSWKSLLVGALAFAIQIYGDFAGYTSIARGVSRLLGIELMRNFDQPYLSRNITEFWRRWHISLSNWLRDYLYIPLGGNRSGARRTYINLLLVMLLGGLWHGAATTFLVWGAIHGSLLALHRRLRGGRVERSRRFRLRDLPAIAVTFAMVDVAWIFFRSASLHDAFAYLGGILSMRPGFFTGRDLVTIAALGALTLALDLLELRNTLLTEARPTWQTLTAVGAGAGLALVLVASGSDFVPFIYFQF